MKKWHIPWIGSVWTRASHCCLHINRICINFIGILIPWAQYMTECVDDQSNEDESENKIILFRAPRWTVVAKVVSYFFFLVYLNFPGIGKGWERRIILYWSPFETSQWIWWVFSCFVYSGWFYIYFVLNEFDHTINRWFLYKTVWRFFLNFCSPIPWSSATLFKYTLTYHIDWEI